MVLAHLFMLLWNVTSNLESQQNILIKYADDTNLLVPEHTDCQLDEEFAHIENCALKIK